MRKVYLDNAATTPVHPEVKEAVIPYITECFGNPSSIHLFGREVKKAVDLAREQVADLIGAKPLEIVFTSGATESDNYALTGIGRAMKAKGKGNHIITSAIEHHAILDTCEALEAEGFEITVLPVDKDGLVDPAAVEKAITDKTVLISIMHANNEVGTIQPIKEIGAIAKKHDVLFHVDAVQSVGQIPVNVDDLNVDLMSLSGHKMYGIKGSGALYIRTGVRLDKLIHGGAQERKKRAGTENIVGIVALGKAAEIAKRELPQRMEHNTALRDKLIKGIEEKIPYVSLNGSREHRLPGNVNFCFDYIEGEALLMYMDHAGIAGSTGSACTSSSMSASHVLLAMGVSIELAPSSLRLTIGRENTEEDIDYALETLVNCVNRLRIMSPKFPG